MSRALVIGSFAIISGCGPSEPVGAPVDDTPCAETAYFPDGDGDGWGVASAEVLACDAPADHVSLAGDCDDTDATVSPAATERCNGADDDCDGVLPTDERDEDDDGFAPCTGDPDDADPSRHPAATELPADGIDADGDGLELCYVDLDGDGFGVEPPVPSVALDCVEPGRTALVGDCDDTDAAISPAGREWPDDGVDNDCDPLTTDLDCDGDGWPATDECNDQDPAMYPGVAPAVSWTELPTDMAAPWDTFTRVEGCGLDAMTGGASAADFDGDGFVDLFITGNGQPDRLWRNTGAGDFEDVTTTSGIDHAGTSTTALWLDLEADGDLDLLVVSMGREGNRLYVNDGLGHFTEEAAARGVAHDPGGNCSRLWGASAADVDGDGDLDVHVGEWRMDLTDLTDRSRLFLNDGTGHFVDGTAEAGLELSDRAVFASSFGDLDGDGDIDLAMAGDWGSSGLFLNDGTGTFTESTALAGVATEENGMGSDLADVDGDGDLDWFVTSIYDPTGACYTEDWGCTGNRLFLNDGTGVFTDGTDAAGVRNGAWGWGAAFFDYDNDGDLDLGMTNGMRPLDLFLSDPLVLWSQEPDGWFIDRACESGLRVTMPEGKAFVPFDLDNDGDLDVLATETAAPPRLFLNDGGDRASWLSVRVAEPGNPFGVGARIDVQASPGGPVISRTVHANSRFLSTGPFVAHFGLAEHEDPLERVTVTWPDGSVTERLGVAPRELLTIDR